MNLTLIQLTQLCSFSVLIATGQYFFKMAALHSPPLTSISIIMGLFLNPWLWAALILYALSTLIWLSVLQSVPLSIAYPFLALGFVVIPLISYVFFKESLNWQYGFGVLLILIALKLITSSVGVK